MNESVFKAASPAIAVNGNFTTDTIDTIICFTHLRWNFVYQRPQHIMSRFAKYAHMFYIEEPVFDAEIPMYTYNFEVGNICIVVPHLPQDAGELAPVMLKKLLDEFLHKFDLDRVMFWYYTPMALLFSRHIKPRVTVFDCMDELSAFQFAPPELLALETALLERADIVFTGGHSLHQHKKNRHSNIHLFPSSIDKAHFEQARDTADEPADQQHIPHPRIGFSGVIDERFDIPLLDAVSQQHPDWQFVIIGPVVKIDPATLPRHDNIHYLGGKDYQELPAYFSGWSIAMIPFAINDSTRFISPTKTPEYLAAGLPVISTPITDVINPYGKLSLVQIAATPAEFEQAVKNIQQQAPFKKAWQQAVDIHLSGNSWDQTCERMQAMITSSLTAPRTTDINGRKAASVRLIS